MRFFITLMIVFVYNQISNAQCTTPTISASGSTTFCQGGSVVLNSSTAAGWLYQWKLNGIPIPLANSASYVVSSGGLYTVTITDVGLNCSATSFGTSVTVNSLPTATIAAAGATTFCQGGSVVLNANTGIGLTYQWYDNVSPLSGATASTYTAEENGSYTVNVTNSNSCSITSSVIVIAVNSFPEISNKAISVCSGTSFNIQPLIGGSDIVPSGTTYTWTVGSNSNLTGQSAVATSQNSISQTLTNNTNTSQTLVYTVAPSSNSCTGSTFTLTVAVNPKPSISNKTSTICSESTFTQIPTNVGGDIVPSGTTYTWTVGNNANLSGQSAVVTSQNSISQTLTNSTNTSQTLVYTVTPSSNSCVGSTYELAVIVNPKPIISNKTSTTCSETAFMQIPTNVGSEIVPSGTTYTWIVGSNANLTGQSAVATSQNSISQTLANSTNTSQNLVYTVTPSSNSCVGSTYSLTVTVNPKPIISNKTSTTCSETAFTQIPTNVGGDIVPSGTTYTWTVGSNANLTGQTTVSTDQNSIGQTLANITNLSQDIAYTVTPVSGLCMGSSFNLIVTVKPKPNVASNLQKTICSEQSVDFTPQNGVNGIVPASTTLTWNAINNLNVNGESNSELPSIESVNQVLTNLNYANNVVTYQIVPVANGCVGNLFNYNVTINKAPNIIVTPTYSICEGGSVQLFAVDAFNTGQLFYNWSNSSTLNNSYIFNPVASPIANTIYSVSVIDNITQCQITRNVAVNVSPLPAAAITYSGGNSICQGSVLILNANPGAGLTYQWKFNDVTLSGQTNLTYPASITGVYSVVVTNSSGCLKTSQGISVSVNPIPVADISNLSTTTFCEGESVIFNTTNVVGNTYQWKLNGNNIPDANLYSFEANQAGSYSVLVTNANSCSIQSPNVLVTVHSLPILDISADDDVLCIGETTILHATGALHYSWTPIDLVSNSSIANPNVFPMSTTNFGVTGTDLNGCSDYQEIQIGVEPNPSLDLPSSIETCLGSIVSLPGAGTIAWSGVSSSSEFNAQQSGYAIATLQNSNFCIAVDSIYIQVNSLPMPEITGSSVVCANSSYSEYAVNSTGNLFSWNSSNGELQGIDNGNVAFIHWFDQEYVPSTYVTITEHDIYSGCEGSDTVFVTFVGMAPSNTAVSLLYPNGSTLFAADYYPIMNWGSTIISNNVDEYTDGHAQYHTFENFDTAIRYYWIEAGDDSFCLTRSYFNAPVWQVGIQDAQENSFVSVYPNPTSDILNLSVDAKNSITSFSIYDYTGHLVKQEFNFKNQSKIDVSDLQVGFYILQVRANNGVDYNQSFIRK